MCVSVYVRVKELETAVMGAFARLIKLPAELCYVHSVMGCFVLAVTSVVSLPTPEGWPVTRVSRISCGQAALRAWRCWLALSLAP